MYFANVVLLLKFIYSEKATKFCEIFTLLLTVCTVVKSKVKIFQNLVAFSEYMNFTNSKAVGSFQFEVCMHLNSIVVNSKSAVVTLIFELQKRRRRKLLNCMNFLVSHTLSLYTPINTFFQKALSCLPLVFLGG